MHISNYVNNSQQVELNIMRSKIHAIIVEVSEQSSLSLKISRCIFFIKIKFLKQSPVGIKVRQTRKSSVLFEVHHCVFDFYLLAIGVEAITQQNTLLIINNTQFVRNGQAVRVFSTGSMLYLDLSMLLSSIVIAVKMLF